MKLHSIQYKLYYEFLAPPLPSPPLWPSSWMSLMYKMHLYAWFQWLVSMYVKIMLFYFLNIAWYVQEFNFTSNESVSYIYLIVAVQTWTLSLSQWFLKYSTLQYASILMALQQHTEDRLIGSLTSFMIALILSPRMLNAQFLFTYS